MSSHLFPSNMPIYSMPVVGTSIPLAVADMKAHKRTCSVAGCKNGIVQGGVCVSHGAKRRQCGFPGCTKSSKSAGMCSKHGPARKPCDTEGCTKISVRGTKCKAHAAPSKICVMEGCRKSTAVGGLCKRHQYSVLDPQALAMGGVPMCQTIIAPAPFVLPQMTYPASQGEIHQMVAAQNMAISGMGMGMNAGFVAPSLSYGLRPTYLHPLAGAPMGGASMGMGGGMRYAGPIHSHSSWSNQAADALAMSRMLKQPREDSFAMRTASPRANANQMSTSFLASFAQP